jgi:hypothetical protein
VVFDSNFVASHTEPVVVQRTGTTHTNTKAGFGRLLLLFILQLQFYHPVPGSVGVDEAALLCFVERNSIEAAVNAVIPAF